VINETLRLYPNIPINIRCALEDTSLPRGGGTSGNDPIGVLKGTTILYYPLALHRQARHFKDPSKFDPERWEGKAPAPWTYIPFNGGPRICVGQTFAQAELGYTITRILQRYARVEDRMDSHRRDRELQDWNLKAEVVLQPLEGVKIGLWLA
jgi:cytochrome P450